MTRLPATVCSMDLTLLLDEVFNARNEAVARALDGESVFFDVATLLDRAIDAVFDAVELLKENSLDD